MLVMAMVAPAAAELPPAASEQELIQTLRTGEPAAKAIACKQLAIYGTKLAVPELAKLLSDPQLASWSRIALEAIPDPAADAALIDAVGTLNGQLLVGVINSIAFRASEQAVAPLIARLKDADAGVAEATAVALGKIGNAQALAALRASLASASPGAARSAIAEGCILGAERLLANKDAQAAAAIYDEVRSAELPEPRILEATRGAIVARGADGIPLLFEQLRSNEKRRFELALITARELPGPAIVEALSRELFTAPAPRAALIVVALGDCATDGLPPAVLKAAASGDKLVRIAAIAAVGRLGDKSALAPLLEIAAGGDVELSDAAMVALAELPGKDVDAEIVNRLRTGEGAALPLLIALVGQRRIDAAADLIKALENEDGAVRGSALSALGATVSAKDLKVLIAAVVSATADDDRAAAEKALSEACIRMPDREATATEVAAALGKASAGGQASLLRVLGAIGGAKALGAIGQAVANGDAQLQDAGTRVLGEWMAPEAGPVLLEIVKNPATSQFHVRALRGYLRIARQLDMRPDERLAMCQKALEYADRAEERKLVLDALRRCPSREALDIAIALLEDKEVRAEALETTVLIGERIKRINRDAAKLAGEKALQASPGKELAERARALIAP